MTEKEAIEILKDMNDGYTFQACRICVSDNKFNEKKGICESKTCEYLNAIDTVIQALEQKDKEIQELKADVYECNNIISDYIDTVKEKDKMIDLMQNDLFEVYQKRPGTMFSLFGERFCKYKDCTDIEITCKECIKEYYEKKARKENE